MFISEWNESIGYDSQSNERENVTIHRHVVEFLLLFTNIRKGCMCIFVKNKNRKIWKKLQLKWL